MTIAIERPPMPPIGPIGNLTTRVNQAQADAMVLLCDHGKVYTAQEFGDALGAHRQARTFLRRAAKRGLIVILQDDALFMWRRM